MEIIFEDRFKINRTFSFIFFHTNLLIWNVVHKYFTQNSEKIENPLKVFLSWILSCQFIMSTKEC